MITTGGLSDLSGRYRVPEQRVPLLKKSDSIFFIHVLHGRAVTFMKGLA
jgi:hypothetical protein